MQLMSVYREGTGCCAEHRCFHTGAGGSSLLMLLGAHSHRSPAGCMMDMAREAAFLAGMSSPALGHLFVASSLISSGPWSV